MQLLSGSETEPDGRWTHRLFLEGCVGGVEALSSSSFCELLCWRAWSGKEVGGGVGGGGEEGKVERAYSELKLIFSRYIFFFLRK